LRTSNISSAICVLVVLCSQAAIADPPKPASVSEKRPWQLSSEERLALRLDPTLIAARQVRAEERDRAMGRNPNTALREGPRSYGVDGSVTPELIFPHELFDGLMAGLVPDQARRDRRRRILRGGLHSVGLDPDNFWAQLETVAGGYARYKYRKQLGTAAAGDENPGRGCRLAFEALTAARKAFGGERFDEILYKVIAPFTQVASATTADPAEELRRVAGGCK
jgi:hypothetical protein